MGRRYEKRRTVDPTETETENTTSKGQTGDDTVRDHLANERTLLAWARTGIAVIALGFVVARFSLLIRELGVKASLAHLPQGSSTLFGTALVVVGAVLMVLATVRFVRTGRAIERHAYLWSPVLGLTLSALLVLTALALAVYLLVSGM